MRVAGIVFTALFLIGGCASNPLVTISKDAKDIEKYQSRQKLELGQPMQAAQNSKAGRGEPMNVLTLSGGGAWGAWGAGFLAGWTENKKDLRPKQFDVVTGISTGGLQATGAFIAADDLLREGYTTVSQRDVMRPRFPAYLSALWSPSIYSTEPLARQICKLFEDKVIDRVADASNGPEGPRKLYVATGELSSGDLVFWDLTAMARDKRYDLYRSVVLATAAIPGAFPPVNIGGELHVDGGVRTSMFLDKSLLELLKVQSQDIRVYVFVNGQTVMSHVEPANRTLPIAIRSVSMLLSAQTRSNLREIDRLAMDENALFWLTNVPDDYVPQGERAFDKVEMNRLFDLGYKYGKENTWTFVRDRRPGKNLQPYYANPRIMEQMKTAK